MLNDHSKVAIAQIAFYVPAVALAAYLFFYRHGRPRLAWYLVFMFSCIRLAGGIVVILFENDPTSVGLNIAAIVLLGVGVVPLIVATIGLIRIIMATDYDDQIWLHRIVVFSRVIFVVGIALLVAGGCLEGNYKSLSSVTTGLKLVKAGYIVIAAILVFLIVMLGYLWKQQSKLSESSMTILKGMTFAIPFLVVRVTYALLSIFQWYDAKWNDLAGSVAPFVCMVLVMEYIVLAIYMGVGLIIPRVGRSKGPTE